ncbi:MAG: hypothetical protein HOF74_05285 [Gammaproteobacteria bacterium]|jgi:hypothetical protein|nr:hypothetical protein [Gammaproteobacteria bacterium]MBT3859223.1 hypothetical protein [Gammaproteobacteria bacterium]MBT3988091.1 hypothetical protein [Gammaproteobacteria bacterium]MBT4254547.1 hypothetical protein [Gammaproteobacteria bacterium]MBT4583022.1 hypothetical protein [Gammaproteobacteria bacterium]
MDNEKKMTDKEITAIGAGVAILGSLLFYWFGQFISTIELLELAYGSLNFFNNPLTF